MSFLSETQNLKFFSFFNIFCKRVEKEKDSLIMLIRSDRGDEFINYLSLIIMKNME